MLKMLKYRKTKYIKYGYTQLYTYLIRNFNKLILKKSLFKKEIECFFLDSNSIIYDCIHKWTVTILKII